MIVQAAFFIPLFAGVAVALGHGIDANFFEGVKELDSTEPVEVSNLQ
jgi:hypothetical protein